MDVSIIIVNYKTPQLVIDCVRSVQEKTKGVRYEMIVVDNASGDGSAELLSRELAGQIRLIVSPENLGFGKANNLGAQSASGEYLFLLNSDTLLMNDAVSILTAYMRSHPQVGVAGGNLYTREEKPNGSYCEEFDDLDGLRKAARWDTILLDILRRRKRERITDPKEALQARRAHDFNFTGAPKKVAYIFGADMLLKRSLFEQLGGFDPDFFMYAEEEELSWRITRLGYEIHSVPDAKIIHFDGASINKAQIFSARHYKMRQTGAMTYYLKRFGPEGPEQMYQWKCLRLQRQLKLGKLLRRPMLTELAQQQLTNLQECFQEFQER